MIARLTCFASAIALALVAPAHAQEAPAQPPAPAAATAAPAAEPKTPAIPALWKVADEDTTIYLFGTIHILPAGMDWNSGAVKTALGTTDELVTEIDMSPAAMAKMGQLISTMAMLPEGTTLRSLMDADQKAAYEAGLAKIGVPAGALDPFKPWFAALQVANAAFMKSGMSPQDGVELNLEKALPADTKHNALETAEYQLGIFDSLPQDVQVEYLLETVDEFETFGPMLQQMTDTWAAGNVDELADLLNDTLEEDPVLAQRLLYDRNANWADWIEQRLDQPGTVFIAVGAGHLAGDKSVQADLAAEGIETARVQ
ncbi:TraB/GumN family protein [Erythrobacter sp. LQ02-29]|uniref:TraB/GumN family protein n=1 Tax=Erythrobacter sp. LQ02-29 TaxID=2920384 RepID=UPI001F4E913E|nr:TraB/GumN family protein [Erythrobacter sp. LQ02-29]MCP9223184.1 TraB/GumN family protein [Erythrobacter sp. LQ02-29]